MADSTVEIECDADGTIRRCRGPMTELYGYRPDDVIGRSVTEFLHARNKPVAAPIIATISSQPNLELWDEVRALLPDGTWTWVAASIRSGGPGQLPLVVSFEPLPDADVAALEGGYAPRDALAVSEERFRHLAEAAPIGVFQQSLHDGCVFVNERWQEITGLSWPEARGDGWLQILHPDDAATALRDHEVQLAGDGGPIRSRFRIVRPDGEVRWVEVGTSLSSDDDHGSVVGTMDDITESVEAFARIERLTAELEHQATHDPLTDLPNRLLLLDRLAVALGRARSEAEGAPPVAVLFLDLDRFKVVNDSLGHALGDRVLVALADRIGSYVGDHRTVARFGGDEFVILIDDLTRPEEAILLAEEVVSAMAGPIDVLDDRFVVSASVGIAIATPTATAETLLRDADSAMYRAKAQGRSRVVVFHPDMRADAVDRFDVEAALRRAIERDELRLHYQPKIDLGTGRIVGVEALVRWQHPVRGLLLPSDFLAVAEETGLIREVGTWVIDHALGALVRFDAARPPGTLPLYLCINLSAAELATPAILDALDAGIDRYGLDPGHIDIELTEHTLMLDIEAADDRLRQLKAIGVKVAIDDFGTGYSSMAYLRRFPVDLLKIDRTFVEGLGDRPEDAAIVRAIATLAESLHLQVVAEGVETARQLAELRAIGVTMAQGFLISRPADEATTTALIAAAPTW